MNLDGKGICHCGCGEESSAAWPSLWENVLPTGQDSSLLLDVRNIQDGNTFTDLSQILHSSFFILHSSFFILHSSFFILHSSFFILHNMKL
jgi:hypothetical protein